jgi:hypothetical protein
MNKSLAHTDKSRMGAKATNKRPAERRNFWHRQVGETRCGVRAAGLFGVAQPREGPGMRTVVRTSLVALAVVSGACACTQDQRAGCVIKGNISLRGERIYHVPGQRYYDQTRINWVLGERWFCTEREAIAAGWRKAKV